MLKSNFCSKDGHRINATSLPCWTPTGHSTKEHCTHSYIGLLIFHPSSYFFVRFTPIIFPALLPTWILVWTSIVLTRVHSPFFNWNIFFVLHIVRPNLEKTKNINGKIIRWTVCYIQIFLPLFRVFVLKIFVLGVQWQIVCLRFSK